MNLIKPHRDGRENNEAGALYRNKRMMRHTRAAQSGSNLCTF
nr:MAG TPA: hypothetical protein [Caudoviricetes sp.]